MKRFGVIGMTFALLLVQPTLLRANENVPRDQGLPRAAVVERLPAPARKNAATQPRAATKPPPISRDRLAAQRALEAKRHARVTPPSPHDAPITVTTQTLAKSQSNAKLQIKPPVERNTGSFLRDPYAYVPPRPQRDVLVAPTSIDAHVMQNLREPLTPEPIEVGDRPGRGTSLCSEGKVRRFGDLDSRTLASNLPDFNVVRPRSVCVRKRSLIADYAFR
jgi:hypothetical protein